jgi:glycine amidinotransferase
VLLNSGRVTPENCPEIFRKWDKIWFQDCVAQPIGLGDFHPPCSTYIGMNILSVDTHTIICDDQQVPLMRELSRHGIDSIGIPFRHAQVLSGGMHCVTLDLRRRGTLEDYT